MDYAEILDAALGLPEVQQRQLRDALEQRLPDEAMHSPERLLARRLLQKGIITRIPPPITDVAEYEHRVPVQVSGKPLSETILEERR